MHARVGRIPYVLVAAVLLALPFSANAAPKDATAMKIADDAITHDYLALRFADAAKKLKSAIATCGAGACSPQVRARIHRDLGVVLITGMKRNAEGKKEFIEALKADPGVTLDRNLATPAVEQAFQAAKGSSPATASPTSTAPAGGESAGDLIHTPAIEQAVLTALPIYVEVPQGLSVTKLIVHYKPFGAPDWQKLELHKMGGGYGGEIPCQAVGSTTGDLSYYVQAQDAEGDVVATSGTRKAPNKVPIQKEISGEGAHLPGRPAPAQCRDKADCPPGFPGCSGGSAATSAKACDTNADCGSDQKCNAEKICESSAASGRTKIWIGAHVQQDFSFVPAEQNVCGSPRNDPPTAFTCYDAEGFLYEGVPAAADPDLGTGNEVKAGPRRSNTRILLDLTYLFAPNFSVGARLGYVIGTAPSRPLAKFHFEARVAYWIGSDPFAKKVLRPYVALLGGVAEVDDKLSVGVYETLCQTPAECQKIGVQPDTNPTLTVWRRGSKNFAGAAAGLMIPTASNQGVLAEVKVQSFFPTTGLTISPVVGYAFGF